MVSEKRFGVIAVKQLRDEILPGVYLTCLQTDKFKTGLLSLNLLTRLSRPTAAMNTLIPSVLRRGSLRYPDMNALASRLDSLYGARVEPLSRKLGEIQAVGFWADFADDAFLPSGGGGQLSGWGSCCCAPPPGAGCCCRTMWRASGKSFWRTSGPGATTRPPTPATA